MSIPSEENSKEKRGSWIKKVLFAIGFLAIFYNFVFFVGRNAVDIPFFDQWSIAKEILGKFDLLHLFFYQHNEHRVGVGLIIMKLLENFSSWSQIVEIKFVSAIIISFSLLITYIKYFLNKKIDILDILIPLVSLNIFQAENIIWGFQIAFVLPIFFLALWLITVTAVKNTFHRNLIITFLSLLSSYSSFHGLFLPLITILYIIADYFLSKENKLTVRKITFSTISINIFIIASYFFGYKKNFQAETALELSSRAIKYFSVAISSGFFYLKVADLNIVIMLAVLVFFLISFMKLLKSYSDKNNLIGFILIFYSLLFIFITTLGRSSFGAEYALTSRYITFEMLIPLGLFFVFCGFQKNGSLLKFILLLFIFLNTLCFNSLPKMYAMNLTENKQKDLLCFRNNGIDGANYCFRSSPLLADSLVQKVYSDKTFEEILKFKKISNLDSMSKDPFYYVSLPAGNRIEISTNDKSIVRMENVQNDASGNFRSTTNDPMIVIKADNISGITWHSSAKGFVQVFYLFEGEKNYQEKYSTFPKAIDDHFQLNTALLEKNINKKIMGIRIDPTNQEEEFSFSDLVLYK